MIYESDIAKLASDWKERLKANEYPDEYKYAVGECIQELNTLLDNSIDQEFLARKYLDNIFFEDSLV